MVKQTDVLPRHKAHHRLFWHENFMTLFKAMVPGAIFAGESVGYNRITASCYVVVHIVHRSSSFNSNFNLMMADLSVLSVIVKQVMRLCG